MSKDRCPYPVLYQRIQSTAVPGEHVPVLPLDERGACIFHSRELEWKRNLDFDGRFHELVRFLIAEQESSFYDFREFVFVGSGAGVRTLRIADTVFPRGEAYFTSAHFVDSLALENVDFGGGAQFNRATFSGDLVVINARFHSLEFQKATFARGVSLTRVAIINMTSFDRAKFAGTTGVRFDDTRFGGITDFSAATFLLDAESSVRFRRTRFEEVADFNRAQFHCCVEFSEVHFAGLTEFIDTAFDTLVSTIRYRKCAVGFNQIVVAAGAVLRFQSTDPQHRMFRHDVHMTFKEIPAGLIQFENVNFQNISRACRENLLELARLGRVEIGSGCIKYRFQTPNTRIDISEGNSPLVLRLCQTFTNYFTVSSGLNLGLEVVERTSSAIEFFFFTDEDISEEAFHERLAATSRNMWSLLTVRSVEQLTPASTSTATEPSPGKTSAAINAVDCLTTMLAIFFGVGIRLAHGLWKESDTRTLQRAVQFGAQDEQLAQSLHRVLVDRYTGAALVEINGEQNAGLPPTILAYRDEPAIEVIDIAIQTAIEVERKAVCEAFGLLDAQRARKGARVYWRGRLALGRGEAYEVVVAQAPDAANIDAAILTNDLLHHWKPGAILLVGIAATANPAKVELGDIVLGSEVYYYERAKLTPGGARPEPKIISADATLWANVTSLPTWDGKVNAVRPDGRTAAPRVHVGAIASGEKVVADAQARDDIAAFNRKILAIEMEGYGFSRAVWQSFEQVRHLDIRAICDDGSIHKDDAWHAYAAAAAAQFARHFLLDRPLRPRGGGPSAPGRFLATGL